MSANLSFPDPVRRDYDLSGGTLSALHFGRVTNPLKLLFVHANGFNASSYAQILGPLGVHAVGLDMRGHGMSALPAEPDALSSWNTFADDIAEFCDRYIDRPVVMVGHSFGAVSLMLAAPKLGPKMSAYIGFDPVIMPPLLSRLSRFRFMRNMMKKRIPIAAKAGRRRAVFDSFDAAIDSYHGRGAFANMPDAVLRDYLRGGLVPHQDGVRLACDPLWEQAIFCSHHHNVARAAKALPDYRQIIFAGPNGPTPAFVQKRFQKRLGQDAVTIDPTLSHLYPLENPAWAREIIATTLATVALNPRPKSGA